MGVCLICDPPRRVDDAVLLAHLQDKHGLDIEAQTWPDGAAVDVEEAA